MAADVALNRELMRLYPFCRLTDTANVLVMPAFHAASISTKMLKELGGATVIGPMLVGLSHPVQICPLGAKDSDIVPRRPCSVQSRGVRLQQHLARKLRMPCRAGRFTACGSAEDS